LPNIKKTYYTQKLKFLKALWSKSRAIYSNNSSRTNGIKMKTSWSKISVTFFFTIALLGSIMRLAPFSDIFFNYEHLLHAHSHVAFQGWIYTALFLLITKLYLTEDLIKKGKYKLQLILTVATILGIMIAFMVQGYAFLSILLSSLFQILNYWLTFQFFKDVKKSERVKNHQFSLKFIKVGMRLMVLSTFGPWAVGILSAKGFAGSEHFNAALYFFLHFQYNGWFTFAILGLFFWLLEHYKINFKLKEAKLFYVLITAAVIPAYTLSLLGMSFRVYFIAFGYIAATLQIVALYHFIQSLRNCFKPIIKSFNKMVVMLMQLVFIAFILKTILQFASAFPIFQQLAFQNRFLIIDFIHLIMIGFMSFFILAIFLQLSYLKSNSMLTKTGITALITGFIGSEIILLALGLSIPLLANLFALLTTSVLMAIGILSILIGQYFESSTTNSA